MRADHVGVVRVPLRVERLVHGLVDNAVWRVLDAQAPLVPDDVLLIVERGLIELFEQVAHAIGLEPQRQRQLGRRHGFEVVRAIEVGRAVDVAAAPCSGGFEQLEVLAARHVLRPLEHHVLEQVRESRAPRKLVAGPT